MGDVNPRLSIVLGLLVGNGPNKWADEVMLAPWVHPHVVEFSAQDKIDSLLRRWYVEARFRSVSDGANEITSWSVAARLGEE
jgi:hypothetical protein